MEKKIGLMLVIIICIGLTILLCVLGIQKLDEAGDYIPVTAYLTNCTPTYGTDHEGNEETHYRCTWQYEFSGHTVTIKRVHSSIPASPTTFYVNRYIPSQTGYPDAGYTLLIIAAGAVVICILAIRKLLFEIRYGPFQRQEDAA